MVRGVFERLSHLHKLVWRSIWTRCGSGNTTFEPSRDFRTLQHSLAFPIFALPMAYCRSRVTHSSNSMLRYLLGRSNSRSFSFLTASRFSVNRTNRPSVTPDNGLFLSRGNICFSARNSSQSWSPSRSHSLLMDPSGFSAPPKAFRSS
jgi:hypothetical protein